MDIGIYICNLNVVVFFHMPWEWRFVSKSLFTLSEMFSSFVSSEKQASKDMWARSLTLFQTLAIQKFQSIYFWASYVAKNIRKIDLTTWFWHYLVNISSLKNWVKLLLAVLNLLFQFSSFWYQEQNKKS